MRREHGHRGCLENGYEYAGDVCFVWLSLGLTIAALVKAMARVAVVGEDDNVVPALL